MNKITLKWDNGELNLDLDLFFPAKKSKIKELKEILEISENQKQNRKFILGYIFSKLEEFKNHKIYTQGWNVKQNKKNLKIISESTLDHKLKAKIQKLSEDYIKWNKYLQNAIDLGFNDNRGEIKWGELLN